MSCQVFFLQWATAIIDLITVHSAHQPQHEFSWHMAKFWLAIWYQVLNTVALLSHCSQIAISDVLHYMPDFILAVLAITSIIFYSLDWCLHLPAWRCQFFTTRHQTTGRSTAQIRMLWGMVMTIFRGFFSELICLGSHDLFPVFYWSEISNWPCTADIYQIYDKF